MSNRDLPTFLDEDARRIALFVPNLKGAGSQRAQILIAKGMAALGEPTDLIVARRIGDFADQVPPGVRIIDLKGRTDFSPLPALVRYLRREQPRALICALNQANLLGLLATRLAKTNTLLVMVVQNHFGAKWKHQFTPTAHLRRVLFRWMYRRADAVVAVAEQLREYLIRDLGLAPERVHAIPNPVDVESVRAAANAPLTHPWLETPREIPVLITVGRLDHQKDHATMIRAMRLVLNRQPVRLLILGEGPLREKLTRLITDLRLQEAVQLVGFQANPHAWMARADLFVLSSLWEGYPLVLLEALALGLPVVSTDCESGPREILGENARVKTNSPTALSGLIFIALSAPHVFPPPLVNSQGLSPVSIAEIYRDRVTLGYVR